MRGFGQFILRVVVLVCSTAIAHGVVQFFKLDAKVAYMLNVAATQGTLSAIAWMISGGTGLVALICWHVFHLDSRLAKILGPPTAGHKSKHARQLQQFYVDGGPFLTRRLPKDISEADFSAFVAEADLWVNKSASWIEQNMSLAARERFLDKTGMLAMSYGGAVNEQHNAMIGISLAGARTCLLSLRPTRGIRKTLGKLSSGAADGRHSAADGDPLGRSRIASNACSR
jgi:hypothetical protein